mgnify:CR=1 FL=1
MSKKWATGEVELSLEENGLLIDYQPTGEYKCIVGQAQAVDLARAILRKWGTGAEQEKEEKVLQHARAQNLGGRWKP